MKDRFDDEQNLSQPLHEITSRTLELDACQRAIYQGLKDIGEEIAAFYLDGLKILQDDNLQTAAYLLAHVAREIDGGLRDILSSDEAKKNIQKQLTTEVLAKFGDPSELKERRGHTASILAALGIEDVGTFLSDDVRVNFATRWINVSPQFPRFVHRHGVWKSPRAREEVENFWHEFESILEVLVGSSLNLLNRLDRILEYEEPTNEIRGTLQNLLGVEVRRAYFFRKLEFPAWLEPLNKDGWFDPDWNPMPQDSPDQPGYYYSSRWHALEYAAKISTHPERPVDILVNIINAITDESRERIDNGRTDLDIVKIIGTLPIDRIEPQHIIFMAAALKSIQKYGLMDQEIGQTILPKLLDSGARELTHMLLSTILEARLVDREIRSVMDDYWLEDALKKYGHAIANLCGVEAVQIALTQIRTLAAEDSAVFHFIHPIEKDLSHLSRADYTELIVSFTSSIFQSAKPVSITEIIQGLLQEPHIIIRRIAVRAITDHYSNLKHLFWKWKGNPLDEVGLEPVISHLIQTNSHTFSESEMEQILQWIESTQY
ncbi:MAG: hypothetical protein OXU36_08905 [Candidatus Poribacteria bacterium]|nr:hypothetical protein [Candidatus Poribacteria bacterium]